MQIGSSFEEKAQAVSAINEVILPGTLLENLTGNFDALQRAGLRIEEAQFPRPLGGHGEQIQWRRLFDGDHRSDKANVTDFDQMGIAVPGSEQAASEANQGVFPAGNCILVDSRKSNMHFAAMGEQRDASRVNGSNKALDFHVLGIQTAVDQLIPCGMNWLWQRSFSKSCDSLAANAGREVAWLSDALDLEQFTESRKWPKGWTEAIYINATSRILEDDSPCFRQ